MNSSKLIEICKKHILSDNIDSVLKEPYIPYLPKGEWNGILVLAEAQNLCNSVYVEDLKKSSSIRRICRLCDSDPDDIGVGPWDDCSIKLAIESAFNTEAKNTAVSNAVLWSQIDENGKNKNPSGELVEKSIEVWADLLPIIRPEHIVTCGNIAHEVIGNIQQTGTLSWKHTKLRLPSRTAMSRISGMFSKDDLLVRYPEVAGVVSKHPKWVEGSYRQNKIFFACHAVSVVNAI